MADDQGEKTEKPSDKKLKDAREKGQVARSRDLTAAATLLAATGGLAFFGPFMIQRLTTQISVGFTAMAAAASRDIQPEDLTQMVLVNGGLIGLLVGPIAFVAIVFSLGTSAAQGGLRFAPKALTIDFTKLNPVNGLSRLAPKQSGLDTLKTIAAIVVLVWLTWPIGRNMADEGLRLPWMSPTGAALQGWEAFRQLMWRSGFALLAIGGADYGLQLWRHFSQLKMTKQEVREESKGSDGSPEMKGKLRQMQRAMARRRMLTDAATATVVLTNPTHYAVALEYNRAKNPAPVVVAKGADLMAKRIREIAREHGVPIIENPPLARALHASADVGETIPAELFSAVAEVLAYLIRIKQLML